MADKGLPPLSPAGPGQPIAHVVAHAELSEQARRVINDGLDYIQRAEVGGESRHVLMRMRGLLRRVERSLMQAAALEAVTAPQGLDFDVTTGRGAL